MALLHDTIEDTETTFQELENEFGQRIASIDKLFGEKFISMFVFCFSKI